MGSLALVREIINRANVNPRVVSRLKGFSGIFQFKLEGEKPFYVEIKADGTMVLHEGKHENPTAIISARDDVMMNIIQGKMDGYQAFFSGLLRVYGDLTAVQKFVEIVRSVRE